MAKSSYRHFQIIGINNLSRQAETAAVLNKLTGAYKNLEFHENNAEPFNFPALINAGAKIVAGEHLLFLNNDIELISSDWLESLLEFSQEPEIGAVGAKLYFPDGRVQHAGVILNLGGIAAHSHKFYERRHPGYFHRLVVNQNLSAVTAACLMVKKTVFHEVGGFDEKHLPVNFNDVDFCLRIREKGYLNVFTPFCEAYHHESVSRGAEDTPEKQARFREEIAYFQQRHGAALSQGDPYYNFNLTVCREDFSFRP
jgi:GT2 family glycosyltransferase